MGIWLVMTTADGGERPFPIHKSRTVIGRSPTSDVRISVPSVAPHHCELSLQHDELRLTDLGSEEGTLHNGRRVGEAVLADQDRLTVGPVTFRIRRTDDDDIVLPSAMAEPKPGRTAQPHKSR